MGDRHGGRFARRGRALNPPRPQVDTHRGVGFRHGARPKEFAPREKAHHGEGLPTRRTSERICPRAGTLSSAKAYRHGARAKGFAPRRNTPSAKASRHGARAKGLAPRRNTPRGEGLPTRRTSERICPAQKHSPRRKPPDTAHEQKNLPHARRLSSAKASRHGARAKGFTPRGSRSPHVPTNGGPPSTDGQPEKHPFGGVAPERARPLPSSFTEKK